MAKLIETQVRDYTSWRPAYDAHEPSRIEATLANGGVYWRPGDRNDMLLLFEVADVDKARLDGWGGLERRDESGRCIRYADVHIHQLGGPPADVGSTTDGSPTISVCACYRRDKVMAFAGGCLCGRVRYTVEGDPNFAAVCHCRSCQRYTGSAFEPVMVFPS